jgi:hypothetical protein
MDGDERCVLAVGLFCALVGGGCDELAAFWWQDVIKLH